MQARAWAAASALARRLRRRRRAELCCARAESLALHMKIFRCSIDRGSLAAERPLVLSLLVLGGRGGGRAAADRDVVVVVDVEETMVTDKWARHRARRGLVHQEPRLRLAAFRASDYQEFHFGLFGGAFGTTEALLEALASEGYNKMQSYDPTQDALLDDDVVSVQSEALRVQPKAESVVSGPALVASLLSAQSVESQTDSTSRRTRWTRIALLTKRESGDDVVVFSEEGGRGRR
ncbi:unnamed protein product [Prorocentrum cordatum]|uniref:Uncharacterized protein n=1 Tax=Prorocentrum cordatum TaxID=2364126 RepID=A0ABN9Y1S6_9DINO|nr:unnamed protein product [Polarella glacialis]